MAQVFGTPDRDVINTAGYADLFNQIYLLEGDDQLSLTGKGIYTVDAGPGNDVIGAAGSSGFLTLGPGRDAVFVGVDSQLTITDFQAGPGGDTIIMNPPILGPFSPGYVWIQQQGPDSALIMTIGDQTRSLVLFSNVNATSLTSDNFLATQAQTPTDPRVGLVIPAPGALQTGTEGDDVRMGGANADTLLGADGRDYLLGLEGNDSIDGGAGDDDVNGNQGTDVVRGGAGADWVRGGQGSDTVYGDAGNDPHLNGNLGNDLVYGGDGDDTVFGGQGNDTLFGDAGNDVISGDLGRDTLYGGAGADRFVLRAGSDVDYVMDFSYAEGDRIQLAAGATYTVQNSGWVSISLSTGDTLALTSAQAGTFSADWIVYV